MKFTKSKKTDVQARRKKYVKTCSRNTLKVYWDLGLSRKLSPKRLKLSFPPPLLSATRLQVAFHFKPLHEVGRLELGKRFLSSKLHTFSDGPV